MATATDCEISSPQALARLEDLGLTRRQAEVYFYLFAETLRQGYQPSVRDVMRRFGISSPNGVCCHIRALEAKRWLRARGDAGLSRSVSFLRNPDGTPFRGLAVAPAD